MSCGPVTIATGSWMILARGFIHGGGFTGESESCLAQWQGKQADGWILFQRSLL